jgi:IS30 family transposase
MAYTRLSVFEREEISRFLAADPALSWTAIAGCIDRHRGTVQREVDRNGGRHAYRAGAAHARAVRLRPCRSTMLITDRDLAERIATRLRTGYSPAGTARLVGGVCTETIYAGIYSGVLEVKARDVLRTRRHRRRRRNSADHRAPSHFLGSFVSIHDRPAAIDERDEFTHWEGDLIIGKANASALITLNERVSKLQHILDLPGGYGAEAVAERLDRWAGAMPANVLSSLTWDRGSEMALWQYLAMKWGVDVYFADAHSPWQRGQNENGNRQIRWWLPKGTDLSVHTQSDLDGICNVLNTQPRRSLGWKSPNDRYAALTAH